MIISSLIFWSWGTKSLNDGTSIDVGLFSDSDASKGTITQNYPSMWDTDYNSTDTSEGQE